MKVEEILGILTTTCESLAFVIYGFGGLGKTTLAEAVVSRINLEKYNYSRLELYQESEKNNFTKLQRRILRDCFPDYNGGILINLRDYKDGQDHLMRAFKCQKGKPIFIFIDNALWSEDLKKLLPEHLGELPHGSRILVTTRNLAVTDVFQSQPNIRRKPYPLQPLPNKDALEILFKDSTKVESIKGEDLSRILQICSGVPLALKIVGAHLHKQGYLVERCNEILENLKRGENIKEEKLSQRLVDFVYRQLEIYIQEAFLDMCCFFNKCYRKDVEYTVGATAITALLEAGLIISNNKRKHSSLEELVIHDIIRAKGQALAKGSRILDVQSLKDAADEQRLHQIKGIWLVNDESEYTIEEGHLNQTKKSLRVLALGKQMKTSTVSKNSFEELKFLQSSCIPPLPVQLEKLENLRVFHGPFFIDTDVSLPKLPRNVKSMKVINCRSDSAECTNCRTTTGDSLSSSLEKLDFSGLGELPKLPEGFDQFVALEILILDRNNEMQELPEQMCKLPVLKVFSMKMCPNLKCLPESFGQLTKLQYLDLCGCSALGVLPDSFGQLTALRDLNLSRCENLSALPNTFERLTSLQHLTCSSELKKKVQGQISSTGLDIQISE